MIPVQELPTKKHLTNKNVVVYIVMPLCVLQVHQQCWHDVRCHIFVIAAVWIIISEYLYRLHSKHSCYPDNHFLFTILSWDISCFSYFSDRRRMMYPLARTRFNNVLLTYAHIWWHLVYGRTALLCPILFYNESWGYLVIVRNLKLITWLFFKDN